MPFPRKRGLSPVSMMMIMMMMTVVTVIKKTMIIRLVENCSNVLDQMKGKFVQG